MTFIISPGMKSSISNADRLPLFLISIRSFLQMYQILIWLSKRTWCSLFEDLDRYCCLSFFIIDVVAILLLTVELITCIQSWWRKYIFKYHLRWFLLLFSFQWIHLFPCNYLHFWYTNGLHLENIFIWVLSSSLL